MIGRCALACMLAVPLACAAPAAARPPQSAARPLQSQSRPTATDLARALAGPSAAASGRLAYLGKLDSRVRDVATARLTGSDVTAAARRSAVNLVSGGASVDVYVNGDVAAARRQLEALGMRVIAVSTQEPQRLVEGIVPLAALTQAAALPSTRAVMATYADTNTGTVLSEGDAAHHGPQARALGATGAGVIVGIISDSMNRVGTGVAGSQASGNLPADTQVLLDPSSGGSDEGRAMAEIVYDEAPGIPRILFSSGAVGGPAGKAATINSLVSHGARVIADDTFYPTEPYFQDGVVTQAVDRARAADVAYVVSAGNRARRSWESVYSPTADPTTASPSTMDFDPGAAVDTVQSVGTLNGSGYIGLQWAEPFGHVTSDFAVDVYDVTGVTPVFAFTVNSANVTTGIPGEFVQVNAGGQTIGIAIRRIAGTGAPFLKYIVSNQFGTVNIEHATNSGSIDPDAAAAKGALTVAASQYTTPTTPESFSSRGPITRFFDPAGHRLATPDVRNKPEVAGADGVSTSVLGFGSFFGTSAAAPSVAGVAALIRSAKPAMPVAEVYAILEDVANDLDCTATPGAPDPDCGAGFVLADRAVAMALDATPPVVTPHVSPAVPNASGGFYRSAVSVTWTVSDPESVVGALTGCAATIVARDAVLRLTCAATSAGGTTTGAVTIKRDASPPSRPAFIGIAARAYVPTNVPRASAVRCRATDPTSGATCTLRGFSRRRGRHVLTATARNGAGLTTKRTLVYSVVTAVVDRLTLPRSIGVSQLRGRGVLVRVRAVAGPARIVIRLTARVGSRTVTLGQLVVRNRTGFQRLRVHLSAAGKRALAASAPGRMGVVITGRVARTSSTARGSVRLQH